MSSFYKDSLRLTGSALDTAKEIERKHTEFAEEGMALQRRHESEMEEFQSRSQAIMDPLWEKLLEQANWKGRPNLQLDTRYLQSHGVGFLVQHREDGSSREKMH